MFPSHASLLLFLSIAGLSAAHPSSHLASLEERTKCHSGPFLIVAHGTGETGEGALGQITTAFKEYVPDSGSIAIKYPSTMHNYPHSESIGSRNLKRAVRAYVKQCGHKAKIMLLGYSQGANVVSDALAGGSFVGSNGADGLSIPMEEEYSKHVIGVLLFGDPGFVAHEPWDAGTSKKDGLVSRSQSQMENIRRYSSIMKSFCDENDPYCASGTKTDAHLMIHGEYFEKYGGRAVNWLVQLWQDK